MNIINAVTRRSTLLAAALLLVVSATVPSLLGRAHADQLSTRGITLSSSKPGDTNVNYKLKFTPVSNAQELIVDFCGDSPLIGTNCTFDGTNVPDVSGVSVSSVSAGSTGTVTPLGTGSPVHTIKVTGLTMTASTPYTIEFSGIDNPTGTGTFYARILTYTTGNAGNYVWADNSTDPTSVGAGNVDSGGDALSTAAVLTITAKVQEALTFCVYTAGTDCLSASSSALNLGDINGVLSDYTSSYTGNAYFDVASNATHGVVVTMKGDTLKSGSYSIAAQGNGTACVADSTTPTVEQFGLRVIPGAGFTASDGGTTAPSVNFYNCGSASHDINLTDVQSTYGDVVAFTASPSTETQNTVEFNAKSSTTTRAGIYTANEQFIATGTY